MQYWVADDPPGYGYADGITFAYTPPVYMRVETISTPPDQGTPHN